LLLDFPEIVIYDAIVLLFDDLGDWATPRKSTTGHFFCATFPFSRNRISRKRISAAKRKYERIFANRQSKAWLPGALAQHFHIKGTDRSIERIENSPRSAAGAACSRCVRAGLGLLNGLRALN